MVAFLSPNDFKIIVMVTMGNRESDGGDQYEGWVWIVMKLMISW